MPALTLFLDFDGVMHPDGCADSELFVHRETFESLLSEFPSIKIVVSSSWRLTQSLDQMRDRFSPEFRDRMVGVTPSIAGPLFMSREREIRDWMDRNKPAEEKHLWIAVDDQPQWFGPINEHLHVTDQHVGLDENSAAGLYRKLLRLMPNSETSLCGSHERCEYSIGSP